MTQFVEQSLPTPKIRGSNHVIGKFLCTTNCIKTCIEKIKIKEKEAGETHF